MDLPINDLTYHSRKRKDDQMLHSFTPFNMPLKYMQYQMQRQPITSSFTAKQSFLTNAHLCQTPLHQKVSPIAYLQASQQKTDYKSNYEIQQHRQKVRTLSQHLKSALMTNNQVQERYNMLRIKMQEKEIKFMNQTSLIKAEMIILQKQFNQKNDQLRKKNDQINQIKSILQNVQKSEKMITENYEMELKHSESLKNQLINQRLYESELSQMKEFLNKKDNQISSLSQRMHSQQRQIHQYQQMLKKQQEHLSGAQNQLAQVQKSYESLLKQNQSLKQTVEAQKTRMNELNGHIGEICKNSDHLFQEIRENQMQKDILNEQMDKKQLENITLSQKLQEMLQKNITLGQKLQEIVENCHAYEIKSEQLKMGQEILDQKNRQILQKHTKLQQENLQITRINTELLKQIQLLDQQVKELKQVCIRQQSREAELLNIIKDSQDEICKLKKYSKEQAVHKLRQKVQRQLKPTRDVDRRIKTQNQPFTPYQRLNQGTNQRKIPRQNLNDTKGRFKYLSEHENPHENFHTTKQPHPYSQYLSFQPSNPYQSAKYFQEDPNNQGYTFGQYPDQRLSHQDAQKSNYYIPKYTPSLVKDRKSKSFYVERKKSLVTEPNDVYKSTFNPREKPYQSINAMRNSLDLREKSLDLHNILKASKKQVLDLPKHKKTQKIYTQGYNHLQTSYDSKDMFLSRLGKLKLWPKQASSQQVTQRQALKQLPSSHHYVKPQVPIQTIIKQKSTIMQQNKNMMDFNLNNQMIQKNILKLQKNGQSQRLKENYTDGFSVLRERRQENGGGIADSVYNACKKVIYK